MIDIISGANVAIEYDHHEVHHGHSFKLDDVQTVSNTTQKWMVTTPDSKKYAHMIFDALCTGQMRMTVTEGADRAGTTLLTPINRNRVGTPAAATVVVHRGASEGDNDGTTTIKDIHLGITDQPTSETSENRGRNEYVLKPNTKYVIAITTIAEGAVVSLHLDWYEHKDRRMQEHFNVE